MYKNNLPKVKDLKRKIQELKKKISIMKQQDADLDAILKEELKLLDLKKELYHLLLRKKKNVVKAKSAEELIESTPEKPVYWKTGYHFIDDRLGGIPKGAFIQFGAASEAGKTTWSIALAMSLAKQMKVVHFNFEMNDYLLAKKIRMFNPSRTQLRNYLIDDSSSDFEDLLMEIELHCEEGVEFFVIDSRMKIRVKDALSRGEAASRISSALSRICQQNKVTIILINQLSEESQRTGMPNLKESGDQIYEADMVWFLLRKVKKFPKNGEMIEFYDDFRLFKVHKNRYDDTGKEHFTIEVRKEEILPSFSANNVEEIEIDLDDPSITLDGLVDLG